MRSSIRSRGPVFVGLIGLALGLTGCSDSDDDTTADAVSDLIGSTVDVEAITIDEDNDPNDLIGRPNGYDAAVVLKDPRVEDCGSDLGVDCGATIEQWADADAAEDRSEYIKSLQEGSSLFGSEYHYLVGNVLVRVTGELKPSEADEYESAVG